MSELIKKPYKISLWEDEQIYLIKDEGADDSTRYETTILPESGYVLLNKYVRENCLAIIGSNTMDTPIRAFEPKLVRQTNGTNALTFQIFYRYYDEDEECFKLNPFTNLLVNERKVKLCYDGKWYDFVIKQIQEDSHKYTFTYTCQDLYISELSKNGYHLTFDAELENNMGTIEELGTVILDGTDWSVGESDFLEQRNEESLYTYEVEETLTATILKDHEYKLESWEEGQTVEIPQGSIIYICYSTYVDGKKGDKIQFFWRADGNYITDDDSNIINSPNYEATPPDSIWEKTTNLKITSSYRGKTLISSVRTHYLPQIDKHCYKYLKEGELYYAYMGSKFIAFDSTENLITNHTGFISTSGWYGINTSTQSSSVTLGDIEVGEESPETSTYSSIKINFGTAARVGNTGLNDSKALLSDYQGFVAQDRYVLAVKTEGNTYKPMAEIYYTPYESEVGTEERKIFTVASRQEGDERLKDYQTCTLICTESLSYTDIVLGNLNFYLTGNGEINLYDIKLFKEVYSDNKLIIPDLKNEINSVIEDKYFFFKAEDLTDEVTSIDDIEIRTVCKLEEIESKGYVLADSPTFEKVTSITASKSNRFNLIQELCEAFECWARFEIEHDTYGATVYEYITTKDTVAVDGKKYYVPIDESRLDFGFKYTSEFNTEVYERILNKKVIFKEYIGKENYAGFRYGVNLKSISRSLDSKQIVTKLIVESNSNEFGRDGFCTIQRATMNPTGENVIYNFQYYLNNGLIDKEELYNDLYDENKGIGLYTKLYRYNKANAPLIEKHSEISNILTKALARQQVYKTRLDEAEKKRQQYIKNIKDGFSKLSTDVSTKPDGSAWPTNYESVMPDEILYSSIINENIRQRNSSQLVITECTPIVEELDNIVHKYQLQYNTIKAQLELAAEKTDELNNEFFKKYSRFVQEGTWISEDYFDDDLYYLDACNVGQTSAFPQVSYTINVLELSGMEEYKNYQFDVGDKTYIEDVEFFGYVPNTKRPYQEEVIISETTNHLDNPANNTIKVQNYKTRFEDLFQRIAATTQSLQYHEGKYNKASNIVNDDGTINGSVLEKTLNFNYCLSDAISKEISEGGQVINLTSVSNPNRHIRLSGLGIQLSNDGGLNWQTAITADGINADVGVFGSLHTNSVRIYSGESESFLWDDKGLTSYWIDENNYTRVDRFVRMDKWGIYGYVGADGKNYYPNSVDNVINNSIFSLTWNGLNIRDANNTNYLKLSTTNSVKEAVTCYEVFKDEATNITKLITNTKQLSKKIWSGTIKEGIETDNFIVYEDGTLKAVNGIFSGTIYATAVKSAMVFDGGEESFLIGRELGIGGDAPNSLIPSDGNFYVTADGDVTMQGSIWMESSGESIHLNGKICVHNGLSSDTSTKVGHLGYISGADANNKITTGIGMVSTKNTFAVVTTGGARLSAGNSKVVVTLADDNDGEGSGYEGSASMTHKDASLKLQTDSTTKKGEIVYKSNLTDGSWRNLEYAYFA